MNRFNPRSHEGSDRARKFGYSELIKFQSTLPRGERLLFVPNIINQWSVSIHAPTRGATYFMLQMRQIQMVSIHAPTRGATIVGCTFLQIYGVSIHAPTRGATCDRRSSLYAQRFQSTLPRGERLKLVCTHFVCCVFQSTLPRGERLYDVYIVDITIVTSSFLRM